MLYRYIVLIHSNTRVFYIRIEILLTDINYMYYLYTVFVCDYVYSIYYILLFTTYFASKLRPLLTPLARIRIRIFNSPFVTVIQVMHYTNL